MKPAVRDLGMGNGIILRVLEGTVLDSTVAKSLDKLLPGYKIEYFKSKPSYRNSIISRINTLHEAFQFILKAYPPDPTFTSVNVETLTEYAAECRKKCNMKSTSVAELHVELERFTASLVDALAIEWNWNGADAYEEAKACLNEAEQYMLMQRGRADVATLTVLETNKSTQYILQYDKSLSPVYPLFKQELLDIKASNYPKTPEWFKNLKEYQQVYFTSLNLSVIKPITIRQDLNQLLLMWKEAKGKSLNIIDELGRIKNNSHPLPEWFESFSKPQQALFRVLADSSKDIDKDIDQFRQQINKLSKVDEFTKMVGLIPKLPLWYWTLSTKQQYFLEHVLSNATNIEDAFSFIPSRTRTLPAPANYGSHSLYTLNKEGEFEQFYSPRYRSSHIASRDVLDLPQAVQRRHVESNLEKVMEFATDKQALLLQTLISPIEAFDYIPNAAWDYLPEPPPDLELYRIARAAVAKSSRAVNIFQHNHPYNIAKRYYYTGSEDKDSLALIERAKPFVSKISGLAELLEDYKAVLDSAPGTATIWDYDGRELFLSSLEELIILTINGYSYGSCVSGKDRKAIQLIHTDAMILYHSIYGAWPKFGDPKERQERINFVLILVQLYTSRHQQELAGQNALGSNGTKTPGGYLSSDSALAINLALNDKDALTKDDRIATDNEVRNISKDFKRYFSKTHELHSYLIAKQLGEKICTSLYDSLSALINEEGQFRNKGSWKVGFYDRESIPTGIKKISSIMSDEKSGSDNVRRMSKIFDIVLSRPEDDSSRSGATNSVYSGVRRLLEPLKAFERLEFIAIKIVTEWNSLFDTSKRENSSLTMT